MPPARLKPIYSDNARQKAGKAAIDPRRKSRHLNALDSYLPKLTSRETLLHNREAELCRSALGRD